MAQMNRTSKATTNKVVRARRALELRLEGNSYAAIADKLRVGRTTAHRLVRAELESITAECTERATELRAIEVERLDMYPAALAPKIAKGDPKAVECALRVAARRARLLGLDAPERVEVGELAGPELTTALREMADAVERGDAVTR